MSALLFGRRTVSFEEGFKKGRRQGGSWLSPPSPPQRPKKKLSGVHQFSSLRCGGHNLALAGCRRGSVCVCVCGLGSRWWCCCGSTA